MTARLRPFKENSRTQLLSDQLRQRALDLGENAKLPTVSQLRQEMGVSLTTLDSVLRHLETQKVIYRRHGVGIFVSPQLSHKCVGLVCDPAFFQPGTSPFWQQLVEGTRSRASMNGESFRFYLAVPSQSESLPVGNDLVEDVRAGLLNGVLFLGNNKPAVNWLSENGVPVVAFAGWSQWRVAVEYQTLVSGAFADLWEQNCRDIALIVPSERRAFGKVSTDILLSKQGYESAAKTKGLSLLPERIWHACDVFPTANLVPKTHQEQGYAAIFDLFEGKSRDERPDSLIITDDMTTCGALVAQQKLGVRVGHDVKVASHLNVGSSVLHGYEDELTLWEIDPSAVVRSMFGLLERLMSGETPDSDVAWIGPILRRQ